MSLFLNALHVCDSSNLVFKLSTHGLEKKLLFIFDKSGGNLYFGKEMKFIDLQLFITLKWKRCQGRTYRVCVKRVFTGCAYVTHLVIYTHTNSIYLTDPRHYTGGPPCFLPSLPVLSVHFRFITWALKANQIYKYQREIIPLGYKQDIETKIYCTTYEHQGFAHKALPSEHNDFFLKQ